MIAGSRRRTKASFTGVLAVLLTGCLLVIPSDRAAADEPPIDFARHVAPLLEQHCLRCHAGSNKQGELSLETIDDLSENEYVVPGDSASSYLVEVVRSFNGEPPLMPKEGRALTEDQVALVAKWVDQGARWPAEIRLKAGPKAGADWWSLQPLAPLTPPPVRVDTTTPEADDWSRHPVDRFVYRKLREAGLRPNPPAERRVLIRRLYFDLLGLPPDPDEVRRFEEDPDPLAYEKLVDRLLAEPAFGERWARHWLDIAHYADTHGFERDRRRDHAWRYRDYVIRAFNEDLPYHTFLRQQIAGDVVAPEDPQSVVATGFLAAGPWDYVGQVETKSPQLRRAARALDLDDMVTQVLTASVALTVNCARCHDHKLDPITQREYYRLTAVFAGLKRDDRDLGETLSKQYEQQRSRLDTAIDQTITELAKLEGRAVDLADVVGGGNGFGTGRKGLGLDPRTGKVQERPFGFLGNVKPGNYAATDYPFVDGVFVPAAERTQISSTELFAEGLPANSGKAWDMIRHGPVASQFSTVLGTVDYNSEGHSMIGLHANAGVTFDLAAMRAAIEPASAAPGAPSPWQFEATAGYGGRTEDPSAEFRVYVDGQLQAEGRVGRNDTRQVDIELSTEARFLTLIATDGGNDISHDQISFGDPRIVLPAKDATAQQEQQRADFRRRLEELQRKRANLGEAPRFFGVVAETPPTVHVLNRGDPESPAAEVAPGALGLGREVDPFGAADMPEGERRAALADWIVDPDNPLTSRVIVNRLWHWHFGQGLVTTPSDFGYGGTRPSHPELLDWLAAELIRGDWSLKRMHRLLLTSQTYRMSSREPDREAFHQEDNPQRIDSGNRLLWRMNRRRLEAEAVRDSVLAVSGKLNASMYGPGYRDFDYQDAYAPIYTYRTADSPELWRRSVYRFIVRTTPQQFLTTLDCPDPANLTPKRNVTNTALQSLALFNNEFMLKQSEYFAERLERHSPKVEEQLEQGFLILFGRSPSSKEFELSRQFVEDHGLTQFCRVMFNASEFLYVD